MIQFSVFRKDLPVQCVVTSQWYDVEDARSYLKALTEGWTETGHSKKHKVYGYTNGVSITTNYSQRRIRKGIKPKNELDNLAEFIMKKVTMASGNTRKVARQKSKERVNGTLIPLKKLCQEYELDPRKARMQLRAAIKKGTIKHSKGQRWEWEEGSDLLKDVRKVLKGD